MPKLIDGSEIKRVVMYFRVSASVDVRIRKAAMRDGQTMSEWLHDASIQKLNRDEARAAADGNGRRR